MIVVVLLVAQEINKELQRKNSKKKKKKTKRTYCLTKRNLINVMMKTGARCTWPPKLRLFFSKPSWYNTWAFTGSLYRVLRGELIHNTPKYSTCQSCPKVTPRRHDVVHQAKSKGLIRKTSRRHK